jgi:hypothetical protein
MLPQVSNVMMAERVLHVTLTVRLVRAVTAQSTQLLAKSAMILERAPIVTQIVQLRVVVMA